MSLRRAQQHGGDAVRLRGSRATSAMSGGTPGSSAPAAPHRPRRRGSAQQLGRIDLQAYGVGCGSSARRAPAARSRRCGPPRARGAAPAAEPGAAVVADLVALDRHVRHAQVVVERAVERVHAYRTSPAALYGAPAPCSPELGLVRRRGGQQRDAAMRPAACAVARTAPRRSVHSGTARSRARRTRRACARCSGRLRDGSIENSAPASLPGPAPTRCVRAAAHPRRSSAATARVAQVGIVARAQRIAHAPPPGCGASVRNRCGGSRCLRCGAGSRPRPSPTAAAGGIGEWLAHIEVGQRRRAARTCSTGTPAGSRRSRRCGCRSAARNSTGIGPSCSIVRYEMQRRASSRYGATMACVGHTSMQARQLPQCALTGAVVGGNARSSEDLAQEEHRAGLAVQRQRVLAAPADAAARGQLHFEHRRRIGEDAVSERPDRVGQPRAPAPAAARAAPCDSRGRGHTATRSPRPDRAGAAIRSPASRCRCRAAGSPCAR